MATIKKRGSSYLVTVSNGLRPDGSQIRVTKTFHPTAKTAAAIKKEVEYFAVDFERSVKEGRYLTGEKKVFKDFADTWFRDIGSESLTTATFEQYRNMIDRVYMPVLSNMKMSDITPLHIKNIYSEMKDRGLSLESIKRHHVALNQIMKYAYEMDVIDRNPCDKSKPPRMTREEREAVNHGLRYFNVEQAKRFLEALKIKFPRPRKAHMSKSPLDGKKFPVSEYVMYKGVPYQLQVYFTIAVYSGFRRGEMIPLTWEDIDFENNTISINKGVAKTKQGPIIKCPKTTSSIRTIELPPICFEMLQKWKIEQMQLPLMLGTRWKAYRGREFDKNFIFIQQETGKMMDIETPYNRFKDIIRSYNAMQSDDSLKLPDITLHELRHTSATLLIAHGVDIETVSHRLGHAKASVTLDIYGHFMEDMDRTAAKTLASIL